MLGTEITNEEKFDKVCDVCFELASKQIYRGGIDGSITIYLKDDEITFTGEHGVSDYEDQFGFKIVEVPEYIECPKCDGEGQYWKDESRLCSAPVSSCCGGCGFDVECDECSRTGKVENPEYN